MYIFIATFNIISKREDWKIRQLFQLMDNYNIGMIAIQENEGIHEEKIMYEKINYHVLSSSAF